MNRSRLLVGGLATIGLTVAALLLVISSAQAKLISVIHTTLEDFNAGILYHTGLTNVDGGEVQLLVVGLAGEWITDTNRTNLPALERHTAVYNDGHILVIGGRDAALQARNEVYYTTINPDDHNLANWQTTTPLPYEVYWHASVVLNDYVYVLGGYDGASYQDTVVYAPINADGTLGNWTTTTPLPEPLRILRAEVVNGRIYVIGGWHESDPSYAEIHYAEPEPDGAIAGWTATTAPLPNPTFGHMLAVHEDHLYVLGGTHPDLFISPLVSFTVPLANGDITSWTGTTNMKNNNYGGAAASYSGVLYTTGGAINNLYTPSDYVGAALINLDGTVDSWQDTSLVIPARFWHAMVSSGDGWLYVINGHDGTKPIASVLRGVTSGDGEQYAPDGTFLSDVIELPDNCPLEELSWNTTITDTSMMTITMRYRKASSPGDWTDWSEPTDTPTPGTVTTTLLLGGSARFFQYEAYFATSNPHNTPVLNAVELVYDVTGYRVGISKDADPPSGSNVSQDDIIAYTLTYSNAVGGITATNAFIADTIPRYTTYVPGSIHGPGANDSNAPNLRWNLGTLEPGQVGTVGYSVMLADPLPGGWLIRNTASIDSNEGGPRDSNEVIHTVVMDGPDLLIDGITIDPACPNPGDTVTYQVAVRNQGTYDATDPFSVELYVKPSPSDPPDGPEDHDQGEAIWEIPELGQGATYVVTFDEGLTWPGAGDYDIYAQADVAFDGPEYRPWGAIAEEDETNNIGQFSPCQGAAGISKDANPPSGSNVSPGQIIAYTLTYSNAVDGITATNAFIADTIPEYTTYVPGSIHGPGANDSNAPDLSWNLGTLEPGQVGTVGYSVMLADPLPGGWLIQNTASIDSNEGGLRISNPVTHTVVMQSPDLLIDRITIDPACPNPGDTVTYQVIVRNQGTYGATDPFWVELYVKPSPSEPPYGPEDHYQGICEDADCTPPRWEYVWQLTELGQGATYVVPFDEGLTWPGAGAYDVYAQVDVAFDGPEYGAWGAIAEEDETNNIGQISPCQVPHVYLPLMYKRSP